jgi:DUF917 family protein
LPILNKRDLEEMVHGGVFWGSGGGGSIQAGLAAGGKALADGTPRLVDLSDLPDAALLVTLSMVGTVGAGGVDHIDDAHPLRALELFLQTAEVEIGGFTVVDAPCNGRAHPTGVMGSLGLHRSADYLTTTVAVGGDREAGTYTELVVRASVSHMAQIVREASAKIDSAVAVIRNPIPVAYVRKHSAVGGLKKAQQIGKLLIGQKARGLTELLQVLSNLTRGDVLAVGRVKSVDLSEKRGFTVGTIDVIDESGSQLQVIVCNEFMMVLREGIHVAVFPDVIALIDEKTCLPMNSSQVRMEQSIGLMKVPHNQVLLSSTMYDRDLLDPIEDLLEMTLPID